MKLNPKKFKKANCRVSWWNYANPGAYFITICTKEMEHYFGNIVDGKMQLSGAGILADVFWHEIKNHSKNIELGPFQVMPNHLHGILIIKCTDIENENFLYQHVKLDTGKDFHFVAARHALPLQNENQLQLDHDSIPRFQNQGKNTVSSIIGSYKSAVTKHANRLHIEFEWQSSFHDHIVRNENEFYRISKYIENNPLNWENDRFFK
jgi:putative transposase